MDRFTVMKSFVSVVRHESFAGAARALGISRALVSRHIADLELQIGIRLVNRTTRSVSATEAGKKYLQFAQRILTEIAEEDASMVAMRENAEGELSVVSPKWIGSLDLGDAVAAFASEHPKIHVRLELGGLSERTYDFIEEGYDIAFHTKNLRDLLHHHR
jgi:DNA-binding transcriptional LysR family regulator